MNVYKVARIDNVETQNGVAIFEGDEFVEAHGAKNAQRAAQLLAQGVEPYDVNQMICGWCLNFKPCGCANPK